ncbi:MAG: hypothetical protein WC685_05465 [Methylobacter sp.]|jgi:hypothetical protein
MFLTGGLKPGGVNQLYPLSSHQLGLYQINVLQDIDLVSGTLAVWKIFNVNFYSYLGFGRFSTVTQLYLLSILRLLLD